jgi:hypothetical protein
MKEGKKGGRKDMIGRLGVRQEGSKKGRNAISHFPTKDHIGVIPNRVGIGC